MNKIAPIAEESTFPLSVIHNSSEFPVFLKTHLAALIWDRELPQEFQNWMDSLAAKDLPSGHFETSTILLQDAVVKIIQEKNLSENRNRDFLIEDVCALGKQFAKLMETKKLEVRFDVIRDNACRKFHMDAVTARLVCTYRGIGTQYGLSHDGKDPGTIFTTPTGSPILLKGSKFDDTPPADFVHRSPPIEGSGETRLILAIDPIQ